MDTITKMSTRKEPINRNSNHTDQAYRQAPWRSQVQWIVTILILVILGLVIAGFYLNISAQTVEAGLAVQKLTNDKDIMQQRMANLRSQLAKATSLENMTARAKELGFRPATFDEIDYIMVENYSGRDTPLMASRKTPGEPKRVDIHPSYTTSLSEWLLEKVITFSATTGGSKP